jgi:hypothetical protein
VDLKSVVPTGARGDEEYVLSADTSATASGSGTIQETFISAGKLGWAMSNTRVSGPFTISESNKSLKVAIDEEISGAITIDIATDAASQTGDAIAIDIENKIKGSTVTGGAKAGNLSYLNARCYYQDGRFIIVSGSASSTMTGTGRSSVSVSAASSNDASETLGFDIPIQSQDIAAASLTETYVTSDVISSTTVPVGSVTNISAGDCIALKTSGGTTYYRYVDSVASPNLIVNAAVSVSENTLVQVLRVQAPDLGPPSFYQDVDALMRHAIEKIVRQINFAS